MLVSPDLPVLRVKVWLARLPRGRCANQLGGGACTISAKKKMSSKSFSRKYIDSSLSVLFSALLLNSRRVKTARMGSTQKIAPVFQLATR